VPKPPQGPQRPHTISRHGDSRVDPYYWLMNREDPEVLSHLEAENAYAASELAPLHQLTETVFQEIKGRVDETDTSVPYRIRSWWYFERTAEGLSYPITCRVPVTDPSDVPVITPGVTLPGEQIILDENAEAGDSNFLSVGVFALSPDDKFVAVGVDFEGNERHQVTFRPLTGEAAPHETLVDVYYGFTWATDSRHVFYTRVDSAMRPWQIWRHELGTDPLGDVLVYQEDDPQYNVTADRTRDDKMIVIQIASSMTTEIRWLPANEPLSELQLFEPRSHGIEYGIDHWSSAAGESWWLKVTNDHAKDFRLLARQASSSEWIEVVPHREGTRLDGIDVYRDYLVLAERLEGSPSVRVIPLGDGGFTGDVLSRSWLVEGAASPSTIVPAPTPEFDSTWLRIVVTSLTTPRYVADVNMATGISIIRKQQRIPSGYDPSDYVTWREWIMASDDVMIPVTLVARRGDVDVSAITPRPLSPRPMVLYGYGSYEISIDPTFSVTRLSLLERGVIFGIAHIRGGGEMGRSWYEMGRLAQKPTTFSDFVRVARAMISEGWTTPEKLAARGGSAGGLLMGAVMNLAPELFTAIVAEVPFVDCLTTMLDDSLPLTAGEWEEWGNPDASETAYNTIKSYSPYDNITSVNSDGSPRIYPHVYAAGGLNDSRVGFWEPAKWVLKLRDASPENYALLRTEMGAGHGGPSGRYDAWRDEARVIAWLLEEIS
jgi:oligopeptidase B